jgi:hypothetical protein
VFSIQKILELLGETINDEICIDGKSYRISSFIALDSGGTGQIIIWQTLEIFVIENAQQLFPLSDSISDFTNIQLYVNGVLYTYGIPESYHILEGNLYWHGDFILETSDQIHLKYSKSI